MILPSDPEDDSEDERVAAGGGRKSTAQQPKSGSKAKAAAREIPSSLQDAEQVKGAQELAQEEEPNDLPPGLPPTVDSGDDAEHAPIQLRPIRSSQSKRELLSRPSLLLSLLNLADASSQRDESACHVSVVSPTAVSLLFVFVTVIRTNVCVTDPLVFGSLALSRLRHLGSARVFVSPMSVIVPLTADRAYITCGCNRQPRPESPHRRGGGRRGFP